MTVTAPSTATSARTLARTLARALAGGAVCGALTGFLVGGVLGRLAMRLLAATSPAYAQGRITDDQAVVGEITLGGTIALAVFATVAGAVGGLVYLWVRRVLPPSRRDRVLGFGLFTGTVGGALFVHDHPSFDYTVLTPTWLAVLLFVALPLLFGLVVAGLVETVDRPKGLLRRAPAWGVVAIGLLVVVPALPVVAPFLLAAFAIALVPALRELWDGHAVTVAGSALLVAMVLWGAYGLVVDVVSVATDTPATAPLNP